MEEIKLGYKQTDIGVIPEDWEVKSILNIAPLQRGFDLPITNITNGIYPVVFSNGILRSHKVYKVKGPGVVTGRSGTIGKLFYVAKDFWPHNTTLWVTNFKGNSPVFVYYLFNRLNFGSLATGSGVPTLNRNDIHELKIGIPNSKIEQTAIATALSDTDALIAALDKKIAKIQQIKQGAMQQLLTGKKRLSGFSGEWVEKKLGEVADIISGGTPDTNVVEYWDGSILWCTPTDITGNKGKYLSNTQRKITHKGLKSSSAVLLPKGTLLLCSRATIGEVCIAKEEVATNQGFKSLVCYDNYSNEFIYYLIPFLKSQMLEVAIGSTFLEISKSNIEKIILKLPQTKSEQTAIAQILTDMDNEITQLEKERDKYKELKAGMMQVLLTGKVRLVNEAVDNKSKVIAFETKPKAVNHNNQINEAVVISFLVNKFSSNTYPLSRFRYTKYAYLLHKQIEHVAKGFKKHVAGPYKSDNRYKGPEKIAIKNRYITKVENPKSGADAFVVSDNIKQALNYFNDWHGMDIQEWIEQFRYYKNDDLEVLTTVDESISDLNDLGTDISVSTIKHYIDSIPQWKKKLGKDCFCDLNIQKMIEKSQELFSNY